MMEERLARLIQRTEHCYYGKYRASVVDNADPEKRGRLRLKIPSVLGENVVSGWALPCAPYGGAAGQGFFFIPDVDAGVWVEFEEGQLEYPIWVGTFWAKPGGSVEVPPPGDGQSPPTSKIIRTTKHVIELADDESAPKIQITDEGNNNLITLDNAGIVVEDKNGNKLTLDSAGVTIKAAQIKVGDGASSEKLVLGTTLASLLDSFQTALMTHTHTGNLGAPTTPPVPPLTPQVWTQALSQHHLVE
ncbi:MAG TPA: phage baseplate assembly protein V [Polyangiaceae bacterium]|nr:phage baseplate assembly protein V [Polyangiaceae bacterium]HKY35567.1 phage baseplate assembly protein V [Polyangiaceae bacterium]